MTFGITAVSIIVIVILVHTLEMRSFHKRLRMKFRQEYGQKPDMDKPLSDDKERALYYNLIKNRIPDDEKLDEVTWEDLEMTQIFRRVNTTVSYAGEQLLFAWLHRLPKDKTSLERREKMIRYFDTHPKEREDTQLLLYHLKKEAIHYYVPEFVEQLQYQQMPFLLLCKLLLCSLLFFIIASVLTANSSVATIAGSHFVFNIVVYAVSKAKYEIQMESLYGILRTVKAAEAISRIYQNESEADRNINDLKKMTQMALVLNRKKQAGLSGDAIALVQDYLLGAFMWDFILYDKVSRLLCEKKESFMELYRFVGEADMSIAVASFRQSLNKYCIPKFCDDGTIRAREIYHPLIDDAVTNDFILRNNMLITGSNASGKSTFIKAVAVNLILGQNIHTCTAEAMSIPDISVLTSMAVRDDVLSGESYYIREIRYLKRMIERSLRDRPAFFGIDEILRGTNTMERIAASIAVLEYLNKKNCMLMVASHDLELAETLKESYDNYHFRESVQEGDVLFDYKLHSGISYTRNAVRLLEAMGFPEEIVSNASKYSS